MNNPEAYDLILSCHTLSGKISDLSDELEMKSLELAQEKQKLRKIVDLTGKDHLIVEGYGLKYRVSAYGASQVRLTLSED